MDRRDEWMEIDKGDLVALLELRFGPLHVEARTAIENLTDPDAVERLILVAANVPNWDVMADELQNAQGSFRIVGEQYNPTGTTKGCD